MDLLKKRKIEDSLVEFGDPDTMPAFGLTKLTIEDSRKLLEPFTREQLLDIVQIALLRHIDVLDAVRLISDRDPAQRKLFVRGIGWDTTHATLRSVFSQYGELEEAVVILDKATGKSKGYGFVTFKHVDGAIQALKEPSKKIDNRVTVTQYAAAGISGAPGGGSVNNPVDISLRKIYVGNVPQDMPLERLLALFSMYGEIEEGPLGFDKVTGKSKGFALLVYKTAEAARASVVETIKNIDGYSLTCKFAYNDGKKGKPGAGAGGPGGVQMGNEAHADAVGVGMAGQISGQYNGHGNMGGYSGYSGFPGGNPLNSAQVGAAGLGGMGVGGGNMGPGAGNQSGGGSLGNSNGFESALGGGYGTGSHYGGGYPGAGSAGAGLGVTGGTGTGLSGAGSGQGASHGSSLYGMPPSSGGTAAGDYPQSAHYSSSASGYQNQHPNQHHTSGYQHQHQHQHHASGYQNQHQQQTGVSPAPRPPSSGMYQGIRPYY